MAWWSWWFNSATQYFPTKFTPLYQGSSSKTWGEDNLTLLIEQSVSSREIQDVELFVYTYNLVLWSVLY